MENRESSEYEASRLTKLIKDYIENKDNSTQRMKLFDMIIEGEDLVNTLDDLRTNIFASKEEYQILKSNNEELTKDHDSLKQDYTELKEKYTTLINKLSSWVKESLPVKVSDLIKKLEE
jgi:predicted nuclease with TOPRIM domain